VFANAIPQTLMAYIMGHSVNMWADNGSADLAVVWDDEKEHDNRLNEASSTPHLTATDHSNNRSTTH